MANPQPNGHIPGQEEIQETTGKVHTSQGIVLTGDKAEEFRKMALEVVEGNNEVIKMLDDLEEEKERKKEIERKKGELKEVIEYLRNYNSIISNELANKIENSGNINELDDKGKNFLFYLAQDSDCDLLEKYLENENLDPNILDINRRSLFDVSFTDRGKKIVEIHPRYTINFEHVFSRVKENFGNNLDNDEKILLEEIDDSSNFDKIVNNKTILNYYILRNNTHFVKLLLKYGVNVNIKFNRELNYLHNISFVSSYNLEYIIKLLIEKGINYNSISKNKETGLCYFVEQGKKDYLEIMLAIPDIDVMTGNPYEIALKKGYSKIAEQIKNHPNYGKIQKEEEQSLPTNIKNENNEIIEDQDKNNEIIEEKEKTDIGGVWGRIKKIFTK